MIRRIMGYMATFSMIVVFILGIFAFTIPSVTDIRLAVVYTGSMEPLMPVGALCLTEPVKPEQIKVGDIIAFNPVYDPVTIVSHRVIEITGSEPTLEFRTKGDANEDPDIYAVPANHVQGRIIVILPYIGIGLVNIRKYVETRVGFYALVIAPTVLLIGIALRDLRILMNPRAGRVKRIKERLQKEGRRRHLSSRQVKRLTRRFA